MDVIEQCAAGVGRVGGVGCAASQPPQQKGIDGTEDQLTALFSHPGTFHMVQYPGYLGRGKIPAQEQARPLRYQCLVL